MVKQISVGEEAYNAFRDTTMGLSIAGDDTVGSIFDELVEMFYEHVRRDQPDVCDINWEDNKVMVYYIDEYGNEEQVELIA